MNTQPDTFTAKLIARGRITIPEAIRELLGLKDGDLVKVQVQKVRP